MEEGLPEALAAGSLPLCTGPLEVVDFRTLDGCRRLCDETAAEAVRQRISDFPTEDVHWIDSGDFHYLTAFWCARLRQPFDLVLLDHHTDMQPAAFDGLLTCGSWVLEMLRHNSELRKVVILGASESLRCETEGFPGRVVMFSENEVSGLSAEDLHKLVVPHLSGAGLYVSVDKDVLACSEYATNWDQGSLLLEPLCGFLRLMRSEGPRRLIGVDICGCTDFPSPRDLAADLAIISAVSGC